MRFFSKLSSITVLIVFPVMLAGCMSIGKSMPHAAAGFFPKTTYNVNYDTAWSKTISVLDMNSIPIDRSNKSYGQIVTGYMGGTSTVGIVNYSSRYKYNIFITKNGPDSTSIKVVAVLQAGGVDAGSFHDVSSENTTIVSGLRNWLYEKLQAAL